jgi:hypothetical protein
MHLITANTQQRNHSEKQQSESQSLLNPFSNGHLFFSACDYAFENVDRSANQPRAFWSGRRFVHLSTSLRLFH